MPSASCWNCDSDIGDDYNYCTQCAVPVSPFQVRSGEGFLRTGSLNYLRAILEGDVSYPNESRLGDELEDALQEQLKEDIRVAVIQLGVVCRADEKLLIRSIDFSPFEEALEGNEEAFEDVPPSLLGLIRLLRNLVEVFPPELFDVFRDEEMEE